MSDGGSNFNWTKLLREIQRQHVIPIIGPELLPYHLSLSAPLALALGVPPQHALRGIGAVADAAGNERLRKASDELERLLENIVEVPRALTQLASIQEFRLILTTDYTSLVERALSERGESCRTLGFSMQHKPDDIDAYPTSDRIVYHLLGHLERFGNIALAPVDQLEYLFRLQAAGPTELLEVLRERKNLLFLGCNLPEWLAGIFTRILLGRPLYETRGRGMEVIACRAAGDVAPAASSLNAFLRNNQVDVYQGDAQSFVDELLERYSEMRDVSGSPHGAAPVAVSKGVVFLSYCRRDGAAVRRFARGLRQRGLEVWFDETELTPGARFDDEIRLTIQEDCCAFVPILSRHTFEREQNYFVREWGYAAEAQRERWRNARFVFPVTIDDCDQEQLLGQLRRRFPEFAHLQLEPCHTGAPVGDRLLDELKEARKRYERRRWRASS